MTRLPVDSWDVRPRLDLPAYELNTVCPVTGETTGLEDHHIFRRSFTALGPDNADLYWVEYWATPHPVATKDEFAVVKNRVALSRDAHERITTNRARLEYRGTDLFYIEDGEEKLLDLNLKLMAEGERVTKRRKPPAREREAQRAKVNYTIRAPKDESNLLPEMEAALREHLIPHFPAWSDDVPAYFVWLAAGAKALQD